MIAFIITLLACIIGTSGGFIIGGYIGKSIFETLMIQYGIWIAIFAIGLTAACMLVPPVAKITGQILFWLGRIIKNTVVGFGRWYWNFTFGRLFKKAEKTESEGDQQFRSVEGPVEETSTPLSEHDRRRREILHQQFAL